MQKQAYKALKNPENTWTDEELNTYFQSDVVAHEINDQWSKIEMNLSQRDVLTTGSTVYFIKRISA